MIDEPITMYSVRFWRTEIKPVQVFRLTSKTAWVSDEQGNLSREYLQTKEGGLYHSWDDARAALIENFQKKLETAMLRLQKIRADIDAIKELRRP